MGGGIFGGDSGGGKYLSFASSLGQGDSSGGGFTGSGDCIGGSNTKNGDNSGGGFFSNTMMNNVLSQIGVDGGGKESSTKGVGIKLTC